MSKPATSNTDPRDQAATTGLRLIGAAAALVVFAVLLTALLIAIQSFGASDATVIYVGKAFTYTGIGAFFIGWKWPYAVITPFRRAGAFLLNSSRRVVATRLLKPIQRGLFVMALFAPCPWLIARVIPELWDSSTVWEYLRSVLYPVISTVFEINRSGYESLWYDWLVIVSLVCFMLAFAWPWTGARLLAWVRGTKTVNGSSESRLI